jgi:hypothetical protein
MSDANKPIACPHCGGSASVQLIYSIEQVAGLLNKTISQVKNLMAQKKLPFRYQLKAGFSLRRVCDYHQLWDYITRELPTEQDLESTDTNATARAIKRIIGWQREGQRKSRMERIRKKELMGD